MNRRMGFILVAALVLGLLGGCDLFMGEDGPVNGAIWWPDGYSFWHTGMAYSGGFPDYMYRDSFYQISKGYHYFYYHLEDETYFYSTYLVAYTVTPDEGTLFKDGEELYFYIDCYVDGSDIYNYYPNLASRSVSQQGDASGHVKTIKANGYTITMTTTPVDPSIADQLEFIKVER